MTLTPCTPMQRKPEDHALLLRAHHISSWARNNRQRYMVHLWFDGAAPDIAYFTSNCAVIPCVLCGLPSFASGRKQTMP